MYCPQCKVEYRQGFRRCSDCDVDLVYALSVPALTEMQAANQHIAALERDDLKPLQRWEGALACANDCRILKDAGITYTVTEIPQVFGYPMEPRPEFEIAVPAAQFEIAKEVLGIQIELGEENLPSEEEIRAVMELPEGEGICSDVGDQGSGDPLKWFPEEASVEVWRGKDVNAGSDKGWMLALALKENRIPFRVDDFYDGSRCFLVLPEGQSRAKEIVREILEAAPPD
jgi:hypothetical protein